MFIWRTERAELLHGRGHARARSDRELGRRRMTVNLVSFHGGIDMQHMVTCGTPDEVTARACCYCELPEAGGGYILGQIR